jgi:hypothetical protein
MAGTAMRKTKRTARERSGQTEPRRLGGPVLEAPGQPENEAVDDQERPHQAETGGDPDHDALGGNGEHHRERRDDQHGQQARPRSEHHHDLLADVEDHRQKGADVQGHVEGEIGLGVLPAHEHLQDGEVAARADGEELGQSLHQPEKRRFEEFGHASVV